MVMMGRTWGTLTLALAWVSGLVGACAEGVPIPEEPPPVVVMVDAGKEPPPQVDAGKEPPVFMGEACDRGETAPCTCDDGGEGIKICNYDVASPTMGSFSSECTSCVVIAAGTETMTAGTMSESGSGGLSASGTGGSSGTGSGGLSGGSGISGGTAAGTGSSGGCDCNQPCVPFGIIACCRPGGSCGCTWAPGAYCL